MTPFNFPLTAAVVPAIAFGAFIAFWIALTRLMRRLARMTDVVPGGAGPMMRKSRWGDANINGSRATGCVRVEEYASGLLVKMHPIFGGGQVWLPADATRRTRDDHGDLILTHAQHRVALIGRLAAFVSDSGTNRFAPVPALKEDTPIAPSKPIGFATPPMRRGGDGSVWRTIAFWVAVALLVYVALRRWAPELIAPIEQLLNRR